MAFEKSVLSIVAYGLFSHLRYLYRFYHSRAARAWSLCNEMYHNVFWYEYLAFQTQIYLHKQYIFDTNIIQSEYALLFPFSIYKQWSSSLGICVFIPLFFLEAVKGEGHMQNFKPYNNYEQETDEVV